MRSPAQLAPIILDPSTLLTEPVHGSALWRRLVEQIPAVTYIADFDVKATLRYVSPQIEELLGYPPEVFLAHAGLWHACVHADDRERVRREEQRTFTAETPFDCEYRMLHRDGREVVVWERDTIIRGDDGVPTHTQGVLIDVTPMRSMRDALDVERANAARYLEIAGTTIVVIDRDARVQLLNRAGYEMVGCPEGALQGADALATAFQGADLDAARARFAHTMATGVAPPRTERVIRRIDGTTRTVAWTHRIMRDEHGEVTGLVSSGEDVTEGRAAEAQIAHMANHDAVTDLPNRRLFAEHLGLAIARAERTGHVVGLLYLDLDDFKLVNDSLGHGAGDRLLVMVADRLRTRARATDLLARHGGDEFLVILGDLDPLTAAADARRAAEGLLEALAVPFVVAGAEFHVGAAVGISLLPGDARDAESLLCHADAAMYQAKHDGRGEIRQFDPDRGEPLQRLSLTTRLRRAIAEDELLLHWQPIVDPVSGRLQALEALVRWQDPVHGLVAPAAFVPLAEETGLIDLLGDRVLELVVAQRARWREEDGFEPTVHVNVSPPELRRPDFAARLAARLAAHDIDPATIVLEITETAAMQDPARVGPLLRELADTGVRIAIDDFGAGHSSLSRLIELPVHLLKIDRSFLAAAPTDPASAAVLESVVSLGAALDMQVVAEGLETEEQRAQLIALGCPLVQGYLVGRPAAEVVRP
jgi:diguanylate cyclase (GGDEF)-like protein/PAS domain S-box-containing protein